MYFEITTHAELRCWNRYGYSNSLY